MLPSILNRAGHLTAIHPVDGQSIEPGRIYVAPPNWHLLIKRGYVRLVRGPRENGHRPAVDPRFRSAARAYGPRVVGVILSGSLDDGTAGLLAVKERGGIAVAQDPADAQHAGMPRSAIENVVVDHVAALAQIPALLTDLTRQPVPVREREAMAKDFEHEVAMAELDREAIEDEGRPGSSPDFACPECGGTLWELTVGEPIRQVLLSGQALNAESSQEESVSVE